MKYKTRQELFDNAALGIRGQGFEVSMIQGTCAYRGENGRRCAIGWSIPNYKIRKRFVTYNVQSVEVRDAAGITKNDEAFARCIQVCHDSSLKLYGKDAFLYGMATLAVQWDLDDSKLWWEVQ